MIRKIGIQKGNKETQEPLVVALINASRSARIKLQPCWQTITSSWQMGRGIPSEIRAMSLGTPQDFYRAPEPLSLHVAGTGAFTSAARTRASFSLSGKFSATPLSQLAAAALYSWLNDGGACCAFCRKATQQFVT